MTMPALVERDFADQFLEAVARHGAGAGLAEIAVDDVDTIDRPARGDGAVTQGVLSLSALAVLCDLPQRRLADVKIGVAAKMIGGDFEVRHVQSPRLA